jgi:hypothetical protein
MPRHRGLTLTKLVNAIDPELMERYFTEKLPPDVQLPARFVMSPKAVEVFMDDPRNAAAKEMVMEDLRTINDICEKAKNHVVRAYQQYGIAWDEDDCPENLAMRLFLDHKEAFDFAYTWFCYYQYSSAMSFHHMPGAFRLTKRRVDAFRKEIKEWFRKLAKGKECIVTEYDEEDTAVILVKHGSYVRIVAYWKGDKIEMTSFRPANEDVLLYDKTAGLLRIKASLQKDRDQYIRSFARCIMGDESLADREDRDTLYTLKPLQNGNFNWNGNEQIKEVLLTEAKLQLPGSTRPVISVSSGDVKKSLNESLHGMNLGSGELVHARFRFVLKADGKKRRVSFVVSPPSRTDLTQKTYADIISAYLKQQGVELY